MRNGHLLGLLGAAMLVGACGAPSNNDPARYGTVAIEVTGQPDPSDLDTMSQVSTDLGALGPDFIQAGMGTASMTITVSIDSGCTRPTIEPNSGVIHIPHFAACGDPAVVQTMLVAMIEIRMGMSEICMHAGQTAMCSPAGYGDAVLNPLWTEDGRTDPHPTSLDIAEFRRTHGG